MDLTKIIGEAVIARLATTDTTTDARPTTAAIDAPHGVIVRTYSRDDARRRSHTSSTGLGEHTQKGRSCVRRIAPASLSPECSPSSP